MMQSTKGASFFVVAMMIAAMPADTVAAQPTKMMQGACFLNTTGSTQFYRAKWTNENWFNVSLKPGRRWCHWRPVGYKQLTLDRRGSRFPVPLARARCESIGRCSNLAAFTQNPVRTRSARDTSRTPRASSGPRAQSSVPRTGRTVSRPRGKFWGVAFFNCGERGNICSIALRGHYTKAQGEGRASYQFVWDAARAQLKARPGLLSRHCGSSRITATYVSVEETENQAHASMAKLLGACRKQSFVRICTDVSPLTGAYFGVLSTATRVGSSGGQMSGPGVCYKGWILVCSSPEVHTFNFLYQVEYRAAEFKQK